MKSDRTWPSLRARNEFDRMLEDVKENGPLIITDARGSFVVSRLPDRGDETLTEFLSKGMPDD